MTRVAVLAGGTSAGRALAAGLSDAGVAVAVLGEPGTEGTEGATAAPGTALPCQLATRRQCAEALQRARDALGGLDAVVDARVTPAATEPKPVSELDAEDFRQRTEVPLQRALHVLQSAYRVLRTGGGGAVVLVVPSSSMTGVARLVPWITAAEGARALAKAAARAWGPEGIRVNCLAVSIEVLAGSTSPLDRAGLPPPALGHADLRRDAGPVLSALVGDGFRGATGQTVAVDGGVWMTP